MPTEKWLVHLVIRIAPSALAIFADNRSFKLPAIGTPSAHSFDALDIKWYYGNRIRRRDHNRSIAA
jgi:hypothetical protein